jgi:hypothetical protein
LRSGVASGNPLDRFHRRSYRLSVRLGPAEVPRQALKEIFNFLASDRLVLLIVQLISRLIDQRIALLSMMFVLLRPERIWILFAHGNLTADIVGEFAG